MFETLHLDVEGGVGERRSAPAPSSTEERVYSQKAAASASPVFPLATSLGLAEVEVRVDGIDDIHGHGPSNVSVNQTPTNAQDGEGGDMAAKKKSKAKKRVAFHSDRPELYDF